MIGVEAGALKIALLAMLVFPAAASDHLSRKIPNPLTLAGILAGLFLHVLLDGGAGALASLEGLLLLFACTFPLFALGGMGAGDVKLIAAVGAVVGVSWALPVLLGIFLTGGVMSAAVMLWDRRLGRVGRLFSDLFDAVGASVLSRQLVTPSPPDDASTRKIPYAFAVAAGSLLTTLYLQYWS